MFTIIAAIGRSNELGKDGDLIWHLPSDMKFFRETTSGHTIIMGRNTFLSLPKGALPNRRNIVLSTRKDASFPCAETFSSLEEAINNCSEEEKVFIIGGASVYKQALPMADVLCITEIDAEAPEADTYFPAIDPTIWKEKSRESHPADEKHPCPYAFVEYVRK